MWALDLAMHPKKLAVAVLISWLSVGLLLADSSVVHGAEKRPQDKHAGSFLTLLQGHWLLGRWSAQLWGPLALFCAFSYFEGGSWRLYGCREAGGKVQLLWDKSNLQLPHPEAHNRIRQRFGPTAFAVPGEQITHLSAAGQLLCGFSLAHVPLDLHTKGSMASCRSCSLPHQVNFPAQTPAFSPRLAGLAPAPLALSPSPGNLQNWLAVGVLIRSAYTLQQSSFCELVL